MIFIKVCWSNRCHENAVKGLWAFWDNIYDMCALDIPASLLGQLRLQCGT
jgi:hypothetical protein